MMATATKKPARAEPAMTAKEARTFEAISGQSIGQLVELIEARKEEGIHEGCECSPYDDIFTFQRWKAQGMMVRKGEKSLRISSYIKPKRRGAEDDANPEPAPEPSGEAGEEGNGKPHRRLIPWTLHLFCRCQVAPTTPRPPENDDMTDEERYGDDL